MDYESVQSSAVEFYSIVASFKLLCDDENKLEIIQTIQANVTFVDVNVTFTAEDVHSIVKVGCAQMNLCTYQFHHSV